MNEPRSRSVVRGLSRFVVVVVLPAVIVVGGILVARVLIATAPEARRNPRSKTVRLVDVVVAEASAERVVVEAMGAVVPATEVDLKPQVDGRVDVIREALVPGGRFETGDPVLEIQDDDYELALARRRSELLEAQAGVTTAQSALITARKDLKVERGNQLVAQREFELLGEKIPEEDRDLVLRVPQRLAAAAAVASSEAAIQSAEALRASAQSRLSEAELDLARTRVQSPFNAVVTRRHVDVGDVASTNTVLVTLVGTDRIWIEAAVPVAQLRWLDIPGRAGEDGSPARIYNPDAWGPEAYREGRVFRLVPELNPQGRMARVLVVVDDPFALKPEHAGRPRLLIGSYVRVVLEGPSLRDVIRLPRSMVWDGDTVRVMTADRTLDLRRVEIAYRGRDHVLISSGIAPGDRIITTDLTTAVQDLPVRSRGDADEDVAESASDAQAKRGGR